MNYERMIKTENTDSRYEAWGDYRGQLTGYIKSCLEENCSKNSWVAIWGAGGCNDIEISELANEYKLLLIDQDTEKLYQVRDRLGLSSEGCKVADVGFWSIFDYDYEMFEALLLDGASYEELEGFFAELIKNMPKAFDLEKYSVDCSVVVGLASQLNARFVALLNMYKEKLSHIDVDKLLLIISHMNQLATERLYISLRQITKKLVITGYETKGCYTQEEADLEKEKISGLFEAGLDGGSYLSGAEKDYITVAGNEFWHRLMYKTIIMDKLEDLGRCKILCWPFSEEKIYPMLMVSLLVNG